MYTRTYTSPTISSSLIASNTKSFTSSRFGLPVSLWSWMRARTKSSSWSRISLVQIRRGTSLCVFRIVSMSRKSSLSDSLAATGGVSRTLSRRRISLFRGAFGSVFE